MTVKITKPPPPFEIQHVNCPVCLANFTADDPKDFRRSTGGDQRDNWDHATIPCPCCHVLVQLEKKRFPQHIYQMLGSV